MSEIQQNQSNPTIIWQSIWGDLFRTIISQITENNFEGAYKTLELLKVMLPPECEKDIEEKYKEVKTLLIKPSNGYNFDNAKENKKNQLYKDMPAALMTLMGEVRKTLYDRHWINKDFSIHPESGRTAKIH